MSGHSKWSTIKHKKAAVDAKRGKIFTRIAKEITIAAREGGGDPETNNRLRLVVAKAKAANMPKDNIERAIKRGTGELEGAEYIEAVYEGYAPHGVGVLVEVVTDNRNRAVADIRHVLNKYGGSMAEAGAVAWQFTRKGFITIEGDLAQDAQDELFMVAVDAGADDVQFLDGSTEIYTDLESFAAVRTALEDGGYEMEEATVIYDPNNPLPLDQAQALQVMGVIERLEELDDVQDVYSTLEITDEALAAIEVS
ncbi:MAG: YebC/PmpR family DNA-binding transcriptional regulator [Ardenticatenaceae bacterium]|nr:YebC/PmpR family DNA-binding transcriptional regulator [Anaerolineales bacterium]MCB8917617.1 YebC/PmpR family DNA-binding transcriptional regulator [Ardenticatenaceae bacterium]